MAEEDLDLVIHLGDYIYEGGISTQASRPRKHTSAEIVSLTDAELVAAIGAGMSSAEIADRHGLTRQYVNRRRAALDMSAPVGRPTTAPACVGDPAWLWSDTITALAAAAGVSVSTIVRARRVGAFAD